MFARLDPARRARSLEALDSTEFDVLVVGGGVVGAGAALDAASRGLSVALVEAEDWAAGTSSRMSIRAPQWCGNCEKSWEWSCMLRPQPR